MLHLKIYTQNERKENLAIKILISINETKLCCGELECLVGTANYFLHISRHHWAFRANNYVVCLHLTTF